MCTRCCLLITISLLTFSYALDNGLVLKPPMGWMTWHRYRCTINCIVYPEDCVSEDLIKRTVDLLISEGYKDAGYEYVIIDDCWMESHRDENGRLKPDSLRFPNGMKAVADYIHSKGLKFGIYEDYGTHTCEGYPGLIGHLDEDAQSFADWEVDYVKVDGCNANISDFAVGYPAFGMSLNKTGRPMVYSCSWPAYEQMQGIQSDYATIAKHCNLWRNRGDVQESWNSVHNLMDWFGNNQDHFASIAGPGQWNDPDMLIIGNFALSHEQAKSQMAVWAIMAAPLLMSNDLRKVRPEDKDVLLNQKVIAVNQDPLGLQGRRVYNLDNIQVWVKPISPLVGEFLTQAIAVVNNGRKGTPTQVSLSLEELGLRATTYYLEDLFEPGKINSSKARNRLDVSVNPTGVVMLRATAVSKEQ